MIVDLPTTAPATRIDRWHIQVTKLPLVACSTIADLIECKRAGEYFGEAWNRTVKARWPNGDVTDPPESLPLAKLKDGDRVDPPAVDMAIVRAQVANPLTKAIDDKSSGAGIRLGFSGPSDGIRYESGQLNAIWQADSPSLLGVRLRPNLVTGQKDAVDAGEFAATFQPVAKLKVPGCAYLNYEYYHNLFSLPAINLRQKPLILPTVAVFYEKGTAEGGADDGYEGDALVIVKGNASPAGSTLLSPGMKVDGCDATESELGRVLLALKVLGVQVPYVQETCFYHTSTVRDCRAGLDELGEAVNRMISNLEAALKHSSAS